MAKKNNWKLIGRKLGMSKNITEWYNTRTGTGIDIIYLGSINKYKVIHRAYKDEIDDDTILQEKTVKTKSQALKYARAYMRKH